MISYLFTFLQINLLLLLSYFLWKQLLRKYASINFQRAFLLLSFPILFLSISLKLDLPILQNSVQVYKSALQEVIIYGNEQLPIEQKRINLFTYGYALVSFILCLRICYSIFRLHLLKRKCRKEAGYYLLPNSRLAFSFFQLIFIGEKHSPKARSIILKHEKIHQERWHSLDIMIHHFIQALFWIFPAVYLIQIALQEVHEYEADERMDYDEEEYIEQLLHQVLGTKKLSIIHSFNTHQLKNRIMRIKQKPNLKSNPFASLAGILMLFIFIAFNQSLRSNPTESNPLIRQGEKTTAQFPGGPSELNRFILENLKYPDEAKGSGTVFIEFTVDQNGNCNDFKAVKSFDKACSEAAIQALKKMPKWEAAEKDGKKVSSKMTLPMRFEPKKDN